MSIILDKVNYIYGEGSGFVKHALKDVSLVINKNEFIEINQISPVYLRASQAEIERNKRLGGNING